MVRGTWLSKNHNIFNYGLPSPLLDSLRRVRNPMQYEKTLVIFLSSSYVIITAGKILLYFFPIFVFAKLCFQFLIRNLTALQ